MARRLVSLHSRQCAARLGYLSGNWRSTAPQCSTSHQPSSGSGDARYPTQLGWSWPESEDVGGAGAGAGGGRLEVVVEVVPEDRAVREQPAVESAVVQAAAADQLVIAQRVVTGQEVVGGAFADRAPAAGAVEDGRRCHG